MCLQKLSAKNLEKTEEEAESIRIETTQKVIAEKLSVKETRKLVSEVMSSLAASSPTPPPPAAKQVLKATGSLQRLSGEMLAKAEASQLRGFQELLRQKLVEVEEALKQK